MVCHGIARHTLLIDSYNACGHHKCDDHKRSKRITDSTDATDLFFHGFLFDVLGLCATIGRKDFIEFSE